jgi:hypothetical protein
MAIPDILKTWAADPERGDLPTSVIQPCYVDFRMVEELGEYHPGTLHPDKYRFKHEAAVDDQDTPYVFVTSMSDDWNQKMRGVMEALKLYPRKIDGVTVLVDDQIESSQGPNLDMRGWKVVEWRVAKGLDAMEQVVHHDIIRWRKGAIEHESLLSWRPYREA